MIGSCTQLDMLMYVVVWWWNQIAAFENLSYVILILVFVRSAEKSTPEK